MLRGCGQSGSWTVRVGFLKRKTSQLQSGGAECCKSKRISPDRETIGPGWLQGAPASRKEYVSKRLILVSGRKNTCLVGG